MELNRAVAENIKRIRKQQKLSLERTAALSGVSRSMLGQIERGEANPSVAILGKLASALKVPAEEFLRNDGFEALRLSREVDNRRNAWTAARCCCGPPFPMRRPPVWRRRFWTCTSAAATGRSLP